MAQPRRTSPQPLPIGIGGSGASIPAPSRSGAPSDPTATGSQGSAGSPSSSPELPADLNGSWRGLMNAIGVGLPHGLNRAVAITNRLHGAVS